MELLGLKEPVDLSNFFLERNLGLKRSLLGFLHQPVELAPDVSQGRLRCVVRHFYNLGIFVFTLTDEWGRRGVGRLFRLKRFQMGCFLAVVKIYVGVTLRFDAFVGLDLEGFDVAGGPVGFAESAQAVVGVELPFREAIDKLLALSFGQVALFWLEGFQIFLIGI